MAIRFNSKARHVIEAVEAECAKLGVQFGGLERTGKHYRATITIDGAVRFITLPVSPSDTDSAHIKRADVRRLVRDHRAGVSARHRDR